MENVDSIINEIRRKKRISEGNSNINKHRWLYAILSKIMILSVLFLGILIYTKSSETNKLNLYKQVFGQNISFATINNLYNKYFGGILPFSNIFGENKMVFNESLNYKKLSIYKDGVLLTVDNNYLVPAQESGIVVFVGEKEGYGKTAIIQQVNGIDLWYGNVDNLNVKIYDYVEKGSLLGETIKNKLYLVYEKEGKFLDYKEYVK